jgi:membrane associated rhomboid family serine protease
MQATAYISILLIIINAIVSYKGFRDTAFFYRYAFSPGKVLVLKRYEVLVTAGFLHTGWLHLIFNMVALFAFSQGLEFMMGPGKFLFIYFASLIAGNLFALRVHRYSASYTAVGASGAVCGLIFASIAIFPGMDIGLFLLPISLPAWLFGVLFVAYSIWGIRGQGDNIGHEAHLAGALAGMIIAMIIFPDALIANYLTILLVLVPTAAFVLYTARNPDSVLMRNPFQRKQQNHTIDQRYNIDKKKRQAEIDRILEKIHRRGMDSLTQREKDILKST